MGSSFPYITQLLLCFSFLHWPGCQAAGPQHQTLYGLALMPSDPADCSQFKESTSNPHWSKVTMASGYHQYVYTQKDIVSLEVMNSGGWEPHIAAELEWAFEQMDAQRPEGSMSKGPIPVLLDVGSNVGYFSLLFAHEGYKVLAFEALSSNAKMMQASLCLNPTISPRVTLLNIALGASRSTCHIATDDGNIGNGFIICAGPGSKAQARLQPGSTLQSSVSLDTLDTLLHKLHRAGRLSIPNTAYVMKIDVEGFELEAMHGAAKFLAAGLVWYIIAEFTPHMMQRASGPDTPNRFPHLMYGLGYNISTKSFKGPFLPPSEVLSKVWTDEGTIMLFMTLPKGHRRPRPLSSSRSLRG